MPSWLNNIIASLIITLIVVLSMYHTDAPTWAMIGIGSIVYLLIVNVNIIKERVF